jgi:hypothetical protein
VIFDAVASGLAAPTQQELLDDVATFGISPLFDGRELERI